MKQFIITVFLILFTTETLFAQDIITKKDGTDIKSEVLEVGVTEIRYKNFANLDGPIYSIPKKDVMMVTYKNGQRDVFGSEETSNDSFNVGVMSFNSWTGQLSLNGVVIDKNATYKYFTPESEALYKQGVALYNGGIIMMSVGLGVSLGWFIGTAIGGRPGYCAAVSIVSAGVGLIGIPLYAGGKNKMDAAIYDYNSKHGLAQKTPELNFGIQNYGIGLALKF